MNVGEYNIKCNQYYMDHDLKCDMRAHSSHLETNTFIFYDFEYHHEKGSHIPNFVVVQSTCSNCDLEPVTPDCLCNNCGPRCNLCDKYSKKGKDLESYLCEGCSKRPVNCSCPIIYTDFGKWPFSEQHKMLQLLLITLGIMMFSLFMIT